MYFHNRNAVYFFDATERPAEKYPSERCARCSSAMPAVAFKRKSLPLCKK
jgi:hypothetical protein